MSLFRRLKACETALMESWPIADELINLRLCLDDIETKEKLRKAWDEKLSGPAGK